MHDWRSGGRDRAGRAKRVDAGWILSWETSPVDLLSYLLADLVGLAGRRDFELRELGLVQLAVVVHIQRVELLGQILVLGSVFLSDEALVILVELGELSV